MRHVATCGLVAAAGLASADRPPDPEPTRRNSARRQLFRRTAPAVGMIQSFAEDDAKNTSVTLVSALTTGSKLKPFGKKKGRFRTEKFNEKGHCTAFSCVGEAIGESCKVAEPFYDLEYCGDCKTKCNEANGCTQFLEDALLKDPWSFFLCAFGPPRCWCLGHPAMVEKFSTPSSKSLLLNFNGDDWETTNDIKRPVRLLQKRDGPEARVPPYAVQVQRWLDHKRKKAVEALEQQFHLGGEDDDTDDSSDEGSRGNETNDICADTLTTPNVAVGNSTARTGGQTTEAGISIDSAPVVSDARPGLTVSDIYQASAWAELQLSANSQQAEQEEEEWYDAVQYCTEVKEE